MSQINSDGDIEFQVNGKSSAAIGKLVKGKTLVDVIQQDENMRHNNPLTVAQSNIFSQEHFGQLINNDSVKSATGDEYP